MADQGHWDDVWSHRRSHAVSWFEADPAVSVALIEQVTGPGDAVVDVGGGASRLVDALRAEGYRHLTVLDIAAASLARARRRLGAAAAEVSWVVADVTRWPSGSTFALWHDRAVLHFLVDAEDRGRYLSVLDSRLAEDGHALLATFAADGPTHCSGLPVHRYDQAGMALELGDGYEPVRFVEHLHHTPTGAEQPFLYGLFRRVGARPPRGDGADRAVGA